MLHRSVLLLFTADILHFTFELKINQMDFCCSNTCCCSSCTTEQCQLPDQPGKQCRCYNTTNVICSRFRSSVHKPGIIELPEKMPIFPTLPEQFGLAQVVLMSTNTESGISPLCCTVGNCPSWIKCENPLNVKRYQSALQSTTSMPLFIAACILFALIITIAICLCIGLGLYISDLNKRQNLRQN